MPASVDRRNLLSPKMYRRGMEAVRGCTRRASGNWAQYRKSKGYGGRTTRQRFGRKGIQGRNRSVNRRGAMDGSVTVQSWRVGGGGGAHRGGGLPPRLEPTRFGGCRGAAAAHISVMERSLLSVCPLGQGSGVQHAKRPGSAAAWAHQPAGELKFNSSQRVGWLAGWRSQQHAAVLAVAHALRHAAARLLKAA